jgi:thymidine phosphorylase
VLKGGGPADLVEISVELAARMVLLGGVTASHADAEQRVRGAIASGAGLERLSRMIEAQGGDPRVVDDYDRLPKAPYRHLVAAEQGGFVSRVDAALVGRASVALGAGRDRVEDPVDAAVGIRLLARPGDEIRPGDGILELHYRDRARLDTALALSRAAVATSRQPPSPASLVVADVQSVP